MYSFNPNTLLNWITAFAIFEIPMALFYLSISKKNDMVTNWYSGKDISIWNVIVQDSLYVICGIILTYLLFNYLVAKRIFNKSFIYFIITFIFVQILGDLLFAVIINKWPKSLSNRWVNYFKLYIKKAGLYALFGDTLYILAWSMAFYFVEKYITEFSYKIFIISLFLFLVSAYSVN